MPIYEYQCTACHHHFDQIQKIHDEPIKICPFCSENKVIRLVSAAGFQLKGSGWYATDFKTKNNPSAASTPEQSSTESTPSESSTTTKTEKEGG